MTVGTEHQNSPTETIGHERQRRALAKLAAADRLPSTLVFSGISGIGKQRVATELAGLLLCADRGEAPCGRCKSCLLFHAGNHPDLHRLAIAEDDGGSVDAIRDVLERMSLRAFLGGRKVAIFDDADHLSLVGANVILKSLEEPRPDTFFILVVSNPARLPATLLSRCQRWFFDRLTPQQLAEVLLNLGIPTPSEDALLLADGSAGAFGAISSATEMWEEMKSSIDRIFGGDIAKVVHTANEWGADKNGLPAKLTLLRLLFRRKLHDAHHDPDAAAVWARALQNAIDLEYLVSDRHVNPISCLTELLQGCRHAMGRTFRQLPRSHPTLMERLL